MNMYDMYVCRIERIIAMLSLNLVMRMGHDDQSSRNMHVSDSKLFKPTR